METLHAIIGSDTESIAWWQMVSRAVLIFSYTLLLVRFGGRRIFGKSTSFDIVLGIILGSTMSRALTGSAPFFPTIAAATAIVLLHWLLAAGACHSSTLRKLVKGSEVLLIKNGQIQQAALQKTNLTVHDLEESLRLSGNHNLDQVQTAYLERSGDVSVVMR